MQLVPLNEASSRSVDGSYMDLLIHSVSVLLNVVAMAVEEGKIGRSENSNPCSVL